MKRSSQVALLLMGVTGVGATGYAMTQAAAELHSARQSGRHHAPAAPGRPAPSRARRAAHGRHHRATAPVHLDPHQQQQLGRQLADVLAQQPSTIGDALDLGAADQPLLDQHQHAARRAPAPRPQRRAAASARRRARYPVLVGRLRRCGASPARSARTGAISRSDTGFDFHTIDNAPYWVESAYYAFTLEQIERDIEAPTAELEAMCRELVAQAIDDERMMQRAADSRGSSGIGSRRSFKRERSQPLRPLRPALRRQGTGQAARVQRRHADLGVRDRRVPVAVAGGRDRAQACCPRTPTNTIRCTSA